MGEKDGIELSVDALVGTAKGSVNISGPSGSTGEGAQGAQIPNAATVAGVTAQGAKVPAAVAGVAAAASAVKRLSEGAGLPIEVPDLLGDLAAVLTGAKGGAVFEFVAPPARHGELKVVSFTGRELISELYQFEVLLSTSWADQDLHQDIEERLLGRPAFLEIRAPGEGARVVHGVVASFRMEANSPGLGRPCVRVELVPKLWLATQRRRSRIFQEMTVPQVVDAVLSEWAIPHSWRVSEEWAPRTYCTQYDETDYEFITRLLAEEGVFFYFAHPSDPSRGDESGPGEELILCDHERAYEPIPSSAVSRFVSSSRPTLFMRSGANALGEEGQTVLEFGMRRTVKPNAALLSGYDSRIPNYQQRAGADLAERKKERALWTRPSIFAPVPRRPGELDVHLHHPRAEYESTPSRAQIEGHQARKALEQLRRDAYVGEGESRVWHLAPGHAFELQGHPLFELDHSYAVTEVDHEGCSTMVEGAKAGYRNRFRCVPDDVKYRPPVPPRRMVQVAETATVVGPGAEEVYTDSQGRIRVRFHWDLEDSPEGACSCWIRVAQPWAGAGWGHQFIPRVGAEVLVIFLRGDPDAPLVTGSAYNGANATAFMLPESKTRSGIRTSSSPGGWGYNELSFEDMAGMEEIRLRAERNLAHEVRNDHLVHVGHDKVETVGNVRTEFVKGAKLETVVGPRVSVAMTASRDIVEGTRQVTTRGEKVEIVSGGETRTLERDQTLKVEGNRSVWVHGFLSTQVGTEEKPSEVQTSVLGSYSTGATDQITLRSEKEIVLECGDSRLVIGPEEVRIESKRIVVCGAESALIEGDGSVLQLTAEALLTGKSVNLYGEGASLELSSTADLNGSKVNLNCGSGSGSAQAGDQERKWKPLKMKLLDEMMGVYAGKHYRIMAGGLRYEGTTDGEGGLTEQVPEEAKTVQVTVWTDEYPGGSTLEWVAELGEEPAPAAGRLPGALQRLKNLGYYDGEVSSAFTPEAQAAIREFQEDAKLEVTGWLDPATVAKLTEVQGT